MGPTVKTLVQWSRKWFWVCIVVFVFWFLGLEQVPFSLQKICVRVAISQINGSVDKFCSFRFCLLTVGGRASKATQYSLESCRERHDGGCTVAAEPTLRESVSNYAFGKIGAKLNRKVSSRKTFIGLVY